MGIMEAQELLAGLEERIRKWGVPDETEAEQLEKMILALERLEGLLTQIESSLKLKLALNEKMESVIDRINRLSWPSGEESPAPKKRPAPALEDTLSKLLHRAKLAARVLDALAAALQMSLESAGKTGGKAGDAEQAGAEDRPADRRSGKEQTDLQAILQPLGTLVQNVVEEKLKRLQTEEKGEET